MNSTIISLDNFKPIKITSPGCCIYCNNHSENLTDEHVIPYALGAHVISIKDACCVKCQAIIQRYEQEVLKKQLGTFRAKFGAPSRTKPKDRPSEMRITFTEIDKHGQQLRDLGYKKIPLAQAPWYIVLWESPPPAIFGLPVAPGFEKGRLWDTGDRAAIDSICQEVGRDKGAKFVKAQIGSISRDMYLRWLAKTAHAFAVAQLGLDKFKPFLQDIILNRTQEIEKYVGDTSSHKDRNIEFKCDDEAKGWFNIRLKLDPDGRYANLVLVFIQLFPEFKTPVHCVVVGDVGVNVG